MRLFAFTVLFGVLQAMGVELPPQIGELSDDDGSIQDLTWVPDDAGHFFDDDLLAFIKKLPSDLTVLNMTLDNTKVSDTGVEALADSLPSGLKNLTLSMFLTGITDDGLEALARALPKSLQSLTLDLEYTKVWQVGLEALAKALPEGLKSLDLDFAKTRVNDAGIEALAKALPEGLKSLGLHFSGIWRVGNVGIEALVDSIPDGLLSLHLDLGTTGVTDAGLEALGTALPDGLENLYLDVKYTEVGDAGIEALVDSIPDGLLSLHLDLGTTKVTDAGLEAFANWHPKNLLTITLSFEATSVGDLGVKAFAAALPDGLRSLDMNLGDTRIGNGAVEAICSSEVVHHTGNYAKVAAGDTFVSVTAIKRCKTQVSSRDIDIDLAFVIDWIPQPWPAKIQMLINGRGSLTGFNCQPQDWIIERDELGQTAYQRASAFQGEDSEIAQCLLQAGGHPNFADKIRFTFGRPKTWSIIAGAASCALILALSRRWLSSRIESRAEKRILHRSSAVAAPQWLRIFEVITQLVLFCGPVALALHPCVSVGVFVVAFLLVACLEHGPEEVFREPVLAFASRTRNSFLYTCLRAAILAYIASAFTTHTSKSCEWHEKKDFYGNVVRRSFRCNNTFTEINLLGVYGLDGSVWRNATNPHLATILDRQSFQTESIPLPFLLGDARSLKVDLKTMFDAYMNMLFAVGQAWPIAIMFLLMWKRARAPRNGDSVHDEDTVEILPPLDESVDAMLSIFKNRAVLMFFLDIMLDINTVFNMLWTENNWFAFILITVWFTSLVEEILIGDIFKLREELQRIQTEGTLSARFKRILAREASLEASVSLGLTAYAFPYVFHSASSMILGMFSMLTSCLTIGKFLHEVLDLENDVLAVSEDAQDQE